MNKYTSDVNSALGAMQTFTDRPVLAQWFDRFAGTYDEKYANIQSQYNQASVLQEMQFNADEAQKSRDWQEYMSSTAYQRAVSDMKKAGINPMLAYMQGGASTPAGATASGASSGASPSSKGSLDGPELFMQIGLTVLDLIGQAGQAIAKMKKPSIGFH